MGIFDKLKKRRAVSDILQESLNEEKEDMIRGVVDLSDTAVKEVMIPRIDVDFIPMDMETEELLKRVAESGHSRFPVYAESIDNVVGMLYVKDLINSFARKEPINLEKIIRKPFFVPESKRIDSLLREFKRRHVHIAVAIDEYGGISGIVCMEDIIEEIVGDIQDEFDNEGEDIASIGEGLWLCDARVDMDDLAEYLHTELPSDEFETLGGFVFDLFGKIPVRYEKVRWKNFDFIIQDMDGHKINTVKIAAVKDDDQ